MKAHTSYNDFSGSVSADISDQIAKSKPSTLETIGDYFKVNKERFKIIGLSIYGTGNFQISLFCIDKLRTKEGENFIIQMRMDQFGGSPLFKLLFKNLEIILHDKSNPCHDILRIDEVDTYNYYHPQK